MKTPKLQFGTVVIAFLLVNIWSSLSSAGFVTYLVSVNTSAISGQVGNLDFQFNPGGSSAENATTTVTGFQTIGGTLSQPAMLTGDASGSLPGTLTLFNGTTYNDAFQGFTYGSSFSFLLTLSGQAINNPGGSFGSSFALSLYDAAGINPLLTIDPNGSVLTVNLNPNGTTSVETFGQSPANSTSVATATLLTSVPEPSSVKLIAIAVLIVMLYYTIRIYYTRSIRHLIMLSWIH